MTIFFKFWHQQVYLRSGNLVLEFKNLMSLTQAIIQVGPHFQTTKWQQNLFPNPHLFSKWIVLPTSCCYELDDTLVHCQGCHFPDSMKFPDFSRPRLGSTVSPRPKFSKLGSSTWLKMNFRQQSPLTFPWLLEFCHKFPDFSSFSRSVATLHYWAHCQCPKTLHELCEWTETNIWLLELLFVMNI